MSEKITFKELVEKISKSTRQSEQTTNSFIHELADIIESGLEKGDKITVAGFGKFELKWMDQRKGRNPQTGEEITIPAQNKVVFEPYKALREHVNKPFKHLEARILDESPDQNKTEQPTVSRETETAAAPAFIMEEGKIEKQKDSAETIDDLIKERPSPVKSKIPAVKKRSTQPHDSTQINRDSDPRIFNQPEPAQTDEKEPVYKTDDKGKFYWSYTAASVVILLAVFLLLFLMFWPDRSTKQAETALMDRTPTEQAEPHLAPAPSPSATADEPYAEPPVMEVHSIAAGETLWTIADLSYGDPFLWPVIYASNRGEIDNPNTILAGRSLNLPELSDPDNLTQKDRETVARGYLYVYDWMTDQQPDNAKYYLWAVGSYSLEQLQRVSARVNETDLAFAIQQ